MFNGFSLVSGVLLTTLVVGIVCMIIICNSNQ